MTLKNKVLSVVMLAAASAMVACSKGSGDNVASTPLTALSGCVSGCPANGGVPLMNVTGSTGAPDNISFSATVIGSGYSTGYGAQQQVALGGTVSIAGSQPGGALFAGGQCIIPPGPYQLTTVQGGTLSGSSFSQIRVRAVGPVSVEMILANGYLSSGRISADLGIASINGLPCGNYPGQYSTYNMNLFYLY